MKGSYILVLGIAILTFFIGVIISPYIYQFQSSGQGQQGGIMGSSTSNVTTAYTKVITYTQTIAGASAQRQKEVYVLEAATLKPMVDMLKDVMTPLGYAIYDEAKGSVQLASEINDLGKRADLFIPIDSEVVEKVLIPNGTASWYIVIATSSMVLVYSNASEGKVKKLLDMLEKNDLKGFFDEVLSGNYRIGLGNPDNVPQGYRTLIMLKLAGLMLWGDEGYYIARFNELQKAGKIVYTRDAAALVAQLQTGAIDISFTYLHEALLYNLKYARLPKQLDLSDPSLKDFYSKVNYTTSTGAVIRGAPIEIVVTIPKTAVNKEAALSIIAYLLTDKGRDIMRRAGLIPIDNPVIRGSDKDLFR
ncbi:MAG: substrate-binding domain-containing protein [Sulfolobales archaeon]